MAIDAKRYLDEEQAVCREQEEIDAELRCIEIGTKLHHLLRTERIPGIYSITNSR